MDRTSHQRTYRAIIAVFALATSASAQQAPEHSGPPRDVPIAELGRTYQLTGQLNSPLGTALALQGVVVDGPHKGYEGGPNLRVLRIEGRATQEDIQIPIRPHFYDFGEAAIVGGTALP